jgi:hypothetical protein
MSFQGVNADYGIAIEESGPKLPAIQANIYKPRTMSEKVSLCLSEESFDMLDTEQGQHLGCTPEVCNFGEEDVTMWALPDTVRFVVCGIPRLSLYDKTEKTFSVWPKGQKLKGTSFVTAARLTLAMVKPDGALLLDKDGQHPQLFTLKLTSSKTALINGDRNDPDFRTLQHLQEGLQKHFGKRGVSLTHLVSVGLKAVPKKFTSSDKGESSIGIMFCLDGGAKPLAEDSQSVVFNLIKQPDIQELIYDSFRLKSHLSANSDGNGKDETAEPVDYDSIPF